MLRCTLRAISLIVSFTIRIFIDGFKVGYRSLFLTLFYRYSDEHYLQDYSF